MRVARKGDVKEPLQNPSGEIIYELIGMSEAHGGTKKHSFAIVVLPPGRSSDKHYHRVSEESYYILQGTARIEIDERIFALAPGEACLIVPLERHQIFNTGEDELEFIAISAPAWVQDDSVFV